MPGVVVAPVRAACPIARCVSEPSASETAPQASERSERQSLNHIGLIAWLNERHHRHLGLALGTPERVNLKNSLEQRRPPQPT